MKNRLKKKDIVLMIIILVVAGSCVLLHRIIGEKSADYITVKVNGKIEGVYSLADDQEIVLNNGSNVLKIKNGEAAYDPCGLPGSALCEAEGGF